MTLLSILAIFGLTFLVKETEGPWGIISWLRNKLMINKYVGVFFYKLFSCYFCSGCHAGWIVYLLSAPYKDWSAIQFVLWILAGGTISFCINVILERLVTHD
jgi:hypothetical protein